MGAFWHGDDGVPGLRWSGIVPELRGRGLYRTALHELICVVQGLRPDAEWLEELLPKNRSDLVIVFEKLGFEDWGTISGDDEHFQGGIRMRLPINGALPRYLEIGKGLVDRFEGIYPGRGF
jgi:hypothetical protein